MNKGFWVGLGQKALDSLRQFWAVNRRQIKIGIAVVGIVALTVFVIKNIFFLPDAKIPREHKIPSASEEILVPTELSEVLEAFGPWDSPQVYEGNPVVVSYGPVVLLNEDGGMRVSQMWTISVVLNSSREWIQMYPPEVSKMSIKNQIVTLVTNKGRYFMVGVNQPFILEQTPEMVYVVTSEGNIWGVSSKRATSLRAALS